MTDITKFSRNGSIRDIGDSKARNSIANEFSATTSYNTNDLILHDGQLYKFTKNHQAGIWNSSEVIATNISDNYLPLSGGTMTGTLNTNTYLRMHDTRVTYGTTPSSDVWGYPLQFCDKDNNTIGNIRVIVRNSGLNQLHLAALNLIEGTTTTVENFLRLQAKNDGTQVVTLSASTAWRTALGANSSGIWPISLGGTGQSSFSTQILKDNNRSTLGKTGEGLSTAGRIYAYRWGPYVTIAADGIRLKSPLEPANYTLLVNSQSDSIFITEFLPMRTVYGFGGTAKKIGMIAIGIGGNMYLYNPTNNGTWATTETINFSLTYITNH